MARQFNGTTDFLTSASKLDLTGYRALAVSCWVYLDAAGNSILLEQTPAAGTNNGGWFFRQPAPGIFEIATNNGGVYSNFDFPAPATGGWHHIAFNFDKSSPGQSFIRTVYVDGQPQSLTLNNDDRTVSTFANDFLWFMSRAGTGYFTQGRIYAPAIWAAASGTILAPTDVSQLYALSNPATVQPSSLRYYWSVEGASSPEPATVGTVALSVTGTVQTPDPGALTKPVPGVISFISSNPTTINLAATAATSGTPPYSYQWYRSKSSGFTPDVTTILSGATTLTITDSTFLSPNVDYYYKLVVTDHAAQSATTHQGYGRLGAAPLVIGGVGDSIMAGYGLLAGQDPLSLCGAALASGGETRSVTTINRAVSGTTTTDWLPGGAYLPAAKAAFAAAGVSAVVLMLGTNDARVTRISATSYLANLTTICNDLVGSGFKVILNYPPLPNPDGSNPANTEVAVDLLQTYLTQIDTLINGSTVLQGDWLAYTVFGESPSLYQSDSVHPTSSGAQVLAKLWTVAVGSSLLYPPTPGSSLPTSRPRWFPRLRKGRSL